MIDYNIDIVCQAKSNKNWSHPKGIKYIRKKIQKYWKRSNIIESNIEIKRKQHYQPGGTAITATNNITPIIIERGENKFGLGWWTYITINGRNKKKLTVISPYQPCSTTIQASDSTTAYTQQWYKMEKIGDTEIYVSRNCSCY